MLRNKLKELTAKRQFALSHAAISGLFTGLCIAWLVAKWYIFGICAFVALLLWAVAFGYYLNELAWEYHREKRAQTDS